MSELRNQRQSREGAPSRPEIFRYHAYRLFLRDWFEYLKKTQPRFSLRRLAQLSNLSCAYLPLMLSGKRKLSPKALEKLAPCLGLNHRERDYLEDLRAINDTTSEAARQDAMERIQRMRPYRERNPKEIEVYRYLDRWYYVAIRELVAIPGFKTDPKWIHARLGGRVSRGEIKDALNFLSKNHFIECLPDGTARLIQKEIECVSEVHRIALNRFHRQMLAVSHEILTTSTAPDEALRRHIMGYTFALPMRHFPELKRIIQEAIDRVEALERKSPEADSVYHVTFLAVPLSVPPEKESKQ